MAKALESRQAVPLEEAVLPRAFQLEALMNLLATHGLPDKAEAVTEIKALQANTPPARKRHHERRGDDPDARGNRIRWVIPQSSSPCFPPCLPWPLSFPWPRSLSCPFATAHGGGPCFFQWAGGFL
jgi:hypothetical protein